MIRRWSLKSALECVTSIAMLCAALSVGWKVWAPATKRSTSPVANVENLTISATAVSKSMGHGSVAIVEFSDFQCPYCGKYATETWPRLRREFVDSGRVRYIAMHYPLTQIHPLALQASQAAECAGKQGKFWEMHDRLFQEKDLSASGLYGTAERLGLDSEAFRICLDGEGARQAVRADMAEGARLGIKGTPIFFIGVVQPDGNVKLSKRVQGAVPFETFSAEIANALAVGQEEKRLTFLEPDDADSISLAYRGTQRNGADVMLSFASRRM